jgi:Zn-dependent protease with chaperone function
MSAVEMLNAGSTVWLDRMVAAVCQSTLLALLVAGLAGLLRRAAPGLRYWLWQLVAVKLLLMPLWAVPVPWLRPALPPAEPIPVPAQPADWHGVPEAPDELIEMTWAEAPPPRLAWPSWLLLGWAGVVLAQLARLGWQARRLRQLLREATPAPDAVQALVRDLATTFRLGPPAVVVTDAVTSPFVCGLWRPVLVLPAGLLATLSPDRLRHVVLHELAHVRRGDLLWGWLPEIARLLYFFHPVAYWARWRVRLERELACDRLVLAVSGSDPAGYAETLLQVVTYTSTPPAALEDHLCAETSVPGRRP